MTLAGVDPLEATLFAQVDPTFAASETMGREHALLRSGATSLPVAQVVRGSEAPQGADFVVREELGRGGMGVVWLAGQRALDRDVAIKRLVEVTPRGVAALLHEARIVGRLEHPNIVPVHAVFEDAQGPAVVMKRVSGEEWSARIARNDAPLEEHLEIFLRVCQATAFAHSEGVAHRDIKPSNVMIGDFDAVYLMDWGVARRLDAGPGAVVGTPAYLAPEMLHGRFDARSDVYLLGATLHEVLTGRPRHDVATLADAIDHIERSEPQEYADAVAELGAICNRACARDPDARFESVEALRQEVHLLQVAQVRVATLEALERRSPDEVPYARFKRTFDDARLALDRVLTGSPEHPRAREMLDRALTVMAEAELRAEQPDAAEALLDAMGTPDEALRERCGAMRRRLREAAARLESLERDRDRGVGARGRDAALVALGVGVLLIVAGFGSLRVLYPDYASAPLRYAIVGVVVLMIGAAVALGWQRRGDFNMVNRRIAQVALTTLSLSALQRILGYVGEVDPVRTLQTDALLLTMAGAALTPFHRSGPWLGGLGLVTVLVGTFVPSAIEPLFVALAAAIPLLFLIGRRVRGGATDAG